MCMQQMSSLSGSKDEDVDKSVNAGKSVSQECLFCHADLRLEAPDGRQRCVCGHEGENPNVGAS